MVSLIIAHNGPDMSVNCMRNFSVASYCDFATCYHNHVYLLICLQLTYVLKTITT